LIPLTDSTEDVAVKLLLSRCGAIPLTVCLLIILQILGKEIECADEGADVLTSFLDLALPDLTNLAASKVAISKMRSLLEVVLGRFD
jgi:hypothetical protein